MNAVQAAREALFGDVLACRETRPAAFEPSVPDGARLQALFARSEALLRALAVVEDSPRHDDSDGHDETSLQRIEAKLDLLTALVASLAGAQATDSLRALQWSARGAWLAVDAPAVGTSGLLRVQPADWLPSPLLLPATVIAAADDGVLLRFDDLPPALEAALERHLFRLHRRAVAESRRPR
ncbi:PilZ domain-containing protein [Lysobacter sp. 2RAF19]